MSKIEKIIKAISNPAKYAGLASIAISLGCIPSPSLISVSDDGRYIAVPFTQQGAVYTSKRENRNEEKVEFFIIDSETKTPEYIGDFYGMPFLLTNSRDKIAFALENKPNVVLMDRERKIIIENAGYPSLSYDGELLAYSKYVGKEEEIPRVELRVMNLNSKKEKNLKINGIFSDISPDKRHLSYVVFNKKNGKSYFSLYLADINGRNRKFMADIYDGNVLIMPHWIDNQRVVFSSEYKGEDKEVMVADLKKGVSLITTTSEDEYFPQVLTKQDKNIYFSLIENKEDLSGDLESYSVRVDKYKNGNFMGEKFIDMVAYGFKTTKNKIVYVGIDRKYLNKFEKTDNLEKFKERYATIYLLETKDYFDWRKAKKTDLGEVVRKEFFKTKF